MGWLLIEKMMEGVDQFCWFVMDGRFGVFIVLMVLLWPLTLGACTFLLVLVPVWWTLHVSVLVGTGLTVTLAIFVYINNYAIRELRMYRFNYREYYYVCEVAGRNAKTSFYRLTSDRQLSLEGYSEVRAWYVFVLNWYVWLATWAYQQRKLPTHCLGFEEKADRYWDNCWMYALVTQIAWAIPAYVALGMGCVLTVACFVNNLCFGSAETFVTEVIHGPWRYMAMNW